MPVTTEADARLAADWEDIGGVGRGISPEELEHVATTMFGCPEAEPEAEGKPLIQVFKEAGMLDDCPKCGNDDLRLDYPSGNLDCENCGWSKEK